MPITQTRSILHSNSTTLRQDRQDAKGAKKSSLWFVFLALLASWRSWRNVFYVLTTVPFSHDSIAASMIRWHFSASSAFASILSYGVLFLMSSTHAPIRESNVSPNDRMFPKKLYVSDSIFARGWKSSFSHASVI